VAPSFLVLWGWYLLAPVWGWPFWHKFGYDPFGGPFGTSWGLTLLAAFLAQFGGWHLSAPGLTSAAGQVIGGGRLGGSELTGTPFFGHRPAQIRGTEAEPQQIVAQGLLSCLQYHVP